MKKYISTLIALLIVLVVWLLLSGRFTYRSANYGQKIQVNNNNLIVDVFDVKPSWLFSTRLVKLPTNIERWQELVLLSQSDYLKFIDNKNSLKMYGRSSVNFEDVEKQRKYVIEKHQNKSEEMIVSKIYLVLEPRAKVCHLLIPIMSNSGVFYISLELINGEWYLIPGQNGPPSIVIEAESIINTVLTQKIPSSSSRELERVTRKFNATYLNR